VTGNKKFYIVFQNKENQHIPIEYHLHDTELADIWFHKIKHLKHIPIDPIESNLVDLSNLSEIYTDFCEFADLEPLDISNLNQKTFNILHKIYEENHHILSIKQNNEILYRFHHSIHYHEERELHKTKIDIGWGTKEGPLTSLYECNRYYESQLLRNHLYLPWSELGKTPLQYWKNSEPNNQNRFNQLCKPHLTFRAKFFIAKQNIKPKDHPTRFKNWFKEYKKNWLLYHGIDKWDEIDEQCAPLLAIPTQKFYVDDLKFLSIQI